LLPTFCAIAGVNPPTDRVLDGVNRLPIMLGKTNVTPIAQQVIMAGSTIRQGDWKLYLRTEKLGGSAAKRGGSDRLPAPAGSLFNVNTDPGETKDVAGEHPDVVQRLRAAAESFDKELAAHSRPIGRLDELEKQPAGPSNSSKRKKKAKL
jgi:arylsulfatase A-like enzyme